MTAPAQAGRPGDEAIEKQNPCSGCDSLQDGGDRGEEKSLSIATTALFSVATSMRSW
jgi:hypothetical protein